MDGIYGRVGDAVKIRGLFIAPSQLNRIKEAFGHVRFQLLISRTSHDDILTVRLEPKESAVDAASLADKFSKFFKDECVLTIDRLEFLNPGTIKEDDKLVIDQRQWK
jgi:phenylacetate-CoA ligase